MRSNSDLCSFPEKKYIYPNDFVHICMHTEFSLSAIGFDIVATPKQIRDLMKVDDLTNDEVKSHLQVLTKFYICCLASS